MVRTPEDRLSEIELYELVAEEIENNQQSKGLWTKALSESAGDKKSKQRKGNFYLILIMLIAVFLWLISYPLRSVIQF